MKTSPSMTARFMTEIFDNSAILKSEKNDHPREYTLFVNAEMTDVRKASFLLYTRDLCSSSKKSKYSSPLPMISSALRSGRCVRMVARDSVSSFDVQDALPFCRFRTSRACNLDDISL